MARIKIIDLPKDMKISKEEMRKITGGSDIGDLQYLDAEVQPQTTQTQTFNTVSSMSMTRHNLMTSMIDNMRA